MDSSSGFIANGNGLRPGARELILVFSQRHGPGNSARKRSLALSWRPTDAHPAQTRPEKTRPVSFYVRLRAGGKARTIATTSEIHR